MIPFPFWVAAEQIGARVEVNISLAFLQCVRIALHPWPFVSDMAIFVLKVDAKLQLTNKLPIGRHSLVLSIDWWHEACSRFPKRGHHLTRIDSENGINGSVLVYVCLRCPTLSAKALCFFVLSVRHIRSSFRPDRSSCRDISWTAS